MPHLLHFTCINWSAWILQITANYCKSPQINRKSLQITAWILQITANDCKSNRIDHSRSSKVYDFGTNRKRVLYFLLVRHSNQGPIISDMLQLFGWKLQIFPILLSRGAPLRMFYMVLRAFVVKFTTKKLVMGLFSSEDRMIVVWVILIQHQRVTDRQTDRRTDVRTYYRPSSCSVLLIRCKKHYICDHISSSNALFITL